MRTLRDDYVDHQLETMAKKIEALEKRISNLEHGCKNYTPFSEGGDHMLCSYDVGCGTIGFVEDEKKMLFPTDKEYEEYMEEQEQEKEDRK